MKTIKLAIQTGVDRERIVLALANAGYEVYVKEVIIEDLGIEKSEFYVIFRIKENEHD